MQNQHLLASIRKRPNRIFLIRHGESKGQVDPSIFTKLADNKVPITEVGWKQSIECGERLKAMIGDEKIKFWVSPYKRTLLTFKGIKKAFDPEQIVSVIQEPRIREQDWGNFQNMTEISACKNARKKFGIFYYRFPQGESGADVFDRVSTFLESLFRDFDVNEGEKQYMNAALVSHGITCRMFLMRFLRWDVDKFQRTWNLNNCQIIVLEKQADGKYILVDTVLQEDEHISDEDQDTHHFL